MRELVTGAEAIGRAAIHSGCNFFAGYPITPATPILLYMTRELPKVGGVSLQAEDEISALGCCIGATLAGACAMTATSGPGISLYSENIGLAIMGEVPLVIVDCQRLGPATGGATTTAQGDIQFLRWGTSGGYPVIVLAPATVADCYNLTRRAFDLAERFRAPVFVATDKETVATAASVSLTAYEQYPVRKRETAPLESEFVPYRTQSLSDVAPMSPFGGPHLLQFSGASYDEFVQRAYAPKDLDRLNRHLAAKIDDHIEEISLIQTDLQEGAETLVIGYGITAGAVLDAAAVLRQQGGAISTAIIYSLWPVPERAIRRLMESVTRIVVAELNLGQYRLEIERLAHDRHEVIGVHRVDGALISPADILRQL